jgi:hypothetical protein
LTLVDQVIGGKGGRVMAVTPSRRFGRLRLVIAACAVIAVAACGGSSTRSSSGSSASSSSPTSSSTATTAPSVSGELSKNPSFPVAVGDTWTYSASLFEATVKITSSSAIPGGRQAIMHIVSVNKTSPSATSDVPINFYDDGRVGFPILFMNALGTQLEVKQPGEILLPAPDATAPLPSSSPIDFLNHAGEVAGSLTGTATNGGKAHVTVAAGAYDASIVSVDLSKTEGTGAAKPATLKLWLAAGVGIVQLESTGLGPSVEHLELKAATAAPR